MTSWFADETFWETSYPFMFPAGAFERAASEVERVRALVGTASGALLDLACGPGRHAVPFARAGFRVAGVDRSAFLLAKARTHEGIEWIESDMREFVRPGAFDVALCLFTSFGFFETDEDNRRVLANVRESLKPGGRFVLDVMGKETLARIYEPTSSTRLDGVGTVFMRRKLVDSFRKLENEWTFLPEQGTPKTFTLRHWIYSAHELDLMLRDAGFAHVDIYGDFEGRPYDRAASRLVVVGAA
jgi:SAM-dependent methyltransferase